MIPQIIAHVTISNKHNFMRICYNEKKNAWKGGIYSKKRNLNIQSLMRTQKTHKTKKKFPKMNWKNKTLFKAIFDIGDLLFGIN